MPVDTSISRLVISVESVAGVTLVRPGGGLVRDGNRDVTVSEIQSLDVKRQLRVDRTVFTIDRPQPGCGRLRSPVWCAPAARMCGSQPPATALLISVTSSSCDCRKVCMAATSRSRACRSPASRHAQARVSDAVREPTFRFIDERGASLGTAPLTKGLPHTGSNDFIGTLDLPSVPFQVVMNGVDGWGAPVQRQHGLTYRAQPVALFFHYHLSRVMEPGTSRRLSFSVMNVGNERATFALDVTSDSGEYSISRPGP